MNISSAILRANPEKLDAVRTALQALAGVEIHAVCDDGRFVVTIEDTSLSTPDATLVRLQQLEGVVTASLVYQYCDDAQSEEHD
jgi:nitrate reductase NapD